MGLLPVYVPALPIRNDVTIERVVNCLNIYKYIVKSECYYRILNMEFIIETSSYHLNRINDLQYAPPLQKTHRLVTTGFGSSTAHILCLYLVALHRGYDMTLL